MAVENVFVFMAIFIWVCLGACVVLFIWWRAECRRAKEEAQKPTYAPYADLLGKPCWKNDVKHRVVAVSHKGAICIRRWDDDSGRHGKWVTYKKVADSVSFNEPAEA